MHSNMFAVYDVDETVMRYFKKEYKKQIQWINGFEDVKNVRMRRCAYYAFTDKNTQYALTNTSTLRMCLIQLGKDETIIDTMSWEFVMLRCNGDEERPARHSMTGSRAYNMFMGILKDVGYTKKDVEDVFYDHWDEQDDADCQWHEHDDVKSNIIAAYPDCWYYDLNKAHASLLIELFPKAADRVYGLLNKAAELKRNGDVDGAKLIKDVFNYTVGCIKSKGYSGTYWWIVHRVTERMYALKEELFVPGKSRIIYANTDGMIIQHPAHPIETSDRVGDFKLEYSGTVYTYKSSTKDNATGYWCVQYGAEIKGEHLPVELKPLIDLRTGTVCRFKTTRVDDGVTWDGKTQKRLNYIIRNKNEHKETVIYG